MTTLPRPIASVRIRAAWPLLVACPTGGACTTEAVASVTVTVINSYGEVAVDAEVAYRLDDGAEIHDCEELEDTWVCGWEQAGRFEIFVTLVGHIDASEAVEVPDGDCQVEGQAVTVELMRPFEEKKADRSGQEDEG